MSTIQLPAHEETRFQGLMAQTYKKVYNLAYRLSGNRNDAEDLTQEAFFRAYRGFDKYEGDRPFENWIFRIVTRLFLDMNRSRKRRVKIVSYDAPLRPDGADDTVQFDTADHTAGPEAQLMAQVLSEDLELSLKKLSKDQRDLIYLADVEGVPYNEIAEMMDAPVGTIRSRLHRAHKQLRMILEGLKADKSLLRANR